MKLVRRPSALGRTVRLPRARPLSASAHDLRGGLDATVLKGPRAGDPEEFALRGAGTEGSDFDAVARDLSSKAQCEEAVECLGRRVGGEVRQRLKARGGSKDEDPAAAALNHAGNKQPREVHHGLAVDANLREFLVNGTRVECAELAEAGVVDEDVDFETGAFRGLVDLSWGSGIVEVCGNDTDFCSLGRELCSQGIEAILAARRENYFCAAGCQLPGQFRADACACACNQRPFSFEVGCICHCGFIIADDRDT